MMRLFFAIDIPKDIKEKISVFLKDSEISGNLVDKDNYHITLKFLGEIEDLLPEVIKSVEDISFSSFECSLKNLGLFGPKNSPAVLFIEVNKGLDDLNTLNKLIDKATAKYNQDFKFQPHLTLARTPMIPKNIKDYNFKSIDFPVKEYHLMESTVKKGKVLYKKIKSFKLK